MNIRLVSSGVYLPGQPVLSTTLDARLGLAPGTIEGKTGVRQRHHTSTESLAEMAVKAAEAALKAAQLDKSEIDLIISAGASPIQVIPCNAVFYQRALGLGDSGIPAFDLDATCLSFMVALDVIGALLTAGRYRNALVISSELASPGLNWNHLESSGLFGDAAAAHIIRRSDDGESSQIVGSILETYSSGAGYCQIVGGGSVLPGYQYTPENHDSYLFHMDGRQLFKHAAKQLPETLNKLFDRCLVSLDEVAMVVPHQASLSAMTLIRKRLGVEPERWLQVIEDCGNCIAASIPMGLHMAAEQGRIKRGDLLLLLGTGAGLSIGATLLRY